MLSARKKLCPTGYNSTVLKPWKFLVHPSTDRRYFMSHVYKRTLLQILFEFTKTCKRSLCRNAFPTCVAAILHFDAELSSFGILVLRH